MTLGAVVAGYLFYALIAAFTAFTLLPDTAWEIGVLVVLVLLMTRGAERALGGGPPPGLRG